jgi:hypothetical protein
MRHGEHTFRQIVEPRQSKADSLFRSHIVAQTVSFAFLLLVVDYRTRRYYYTHRGSVFYNSRVSPQQTVSHWRGVIHGLREEDAKATDW